MSLASGERREAEALPRLSIERLPLDGLIAITPRVFADDRGFFLESYREAAYRAAGIDATFVQDNHSRSQRGTLRGLHYQLAPGQAKLVRCVRGAIWDVAVDVRPESPTFGKWHAVELDETSHRQLYIPVGFAHGFCVLSEVADVLYKVSSYYDPATERGFRWDDPDVAITWPITDPILSPRDRDAPRFAERAR
jgi:dTDP-4-dehydrorhamnose 3,5-epimerase